MTTTVKFWLSNAAGIVLLALWYVPELVPSWSAHAAGLQAVLSQLFPVLVGFGFTAAFSPVLAHFLPDSLKSQLVAPPPTSPDAKK